MKNFLLSIIAAINALVTGIYLCFLPAKEVAMHFGIDGKVDRYGSKWELLMLSGIIFAATLIYGIVQAVSAKLGKENKNKKYSKKIAFAVTIYAMVLIWVLTVMTTNDILEEKQYFAMAVIDIIIGCLFVFVGNLTPKFRQNKWFGFKTKATLSSEKVWNKTHRLMGNISVIAGFISIIMGIIGLAVDSVAMVMLVLSLVLYVVVVTIILYFYANSLYKKEKKNESNQH